MRILYELDLSRIILVGLAVMILTLLLVMLIVFVNALIAAPTPEGSSERETQYKDAAFIMSWLITTIGLLILLVGATWTAYVVPHHRALHGLLVGVFVAIARLLFEIAGGMTTLGLATLVAAIGVGWLGGKIGASKRREV